MSFLPRQAVSSATIPPRGGGWCSARPFSFPKATIVARTRIPRHWAKLTMKRANHAFGMGAATDSARSWSEMVNEKRTL